MTTPAELDDHFVYLLPALEDGSLVPCSVRGEHGGRTSAWSRGLVSPQRRRTGPVPAAKFKYEYNDPKERS